MRMGRPSKRKRCPTVPLVGADNHGRKYGRPWDDEPRGLYWCEAVFHKTWVSPIRPQPSVRPFRGMVLVTSLRRGENEIVHHSGERPAPWAQAR